MKSSEVGATLTLAEDPLSMSCALAGWEFQLPLNVTVAGPPSVGATGANFTLIMTELFAASVPGTGVTGSIVYPLLVGESATVTPVTSTLPGLLSVNVA